ncbi:MAG TPA: hypothetical protein VK425_01320 [Acidimicrobiales bacterium]|nr:hypothetical protein [Acidimicrobiales bacterium]
MRALLVGLGAVGARSARQLLSSGLVGELVVFVRQPGRSAVRAAAVGGPGIVQLEQLTRASFGDALCGAQVAILSAPSLGEQLPRAAVEAGVPVVSTSDDPTDVRALLGLGALAEARGTSVVAGAGMAPGLSCLLASWAAGALDELSEVHVATLGTGGPACARRRHAALREVVEEWRDAGWSRRVGSSGRELVWFPGHSGADCYRLNRSDALLLVRAFPALRWVTARAAASRRDRTTSWLPMLRPPHPEGTVGAVRVEVRGRRAGVAETVVVGAKGRPAVLAGTVAAAVAVRAAAGELEPGAGGLASLVKRPGEMLAELSERGAQLMRFEGAQSAASW